MVARDEGHHLDFVWVESAQVAVLDQVVRMPVVARIADVDAEVVHERAVLEPFALAIGEPVDRARLVEQRERKARHLLRVDGVVVAPLGQLDGAAAADVGNLVDLRDLPLVAPDVVEDEALAQREIAERQLLGAETPQDRVEQDGAGDHQVGAAWIQAGHGQSLLESGPTTSFRRRRICLAETRRLRSSAGAAPRRGCGDGADAQDRARRADHAVEPDRRDLLAVPVDFVEDVPWRASARRARTSGRS